MKTRKRLSIVTTVIAILLAFAACSKNETIPKVQLAFTQTGGVEKDGVLQICNGETLSINKVYVVTENSTPSTTIFRTDYYWDNSWIGQNIVPPFGYSFLIDVTPGPHTLTLFNTVGANGYSLTNCVTTIPVYVYPAGTDLGRHLPKHRRNNYQKTKIKWMRPASTGRIIILYICQAASLLQKAARKFNAAV